MATKTIPELTELTTPDLDAVFPIDNGTQTYKYKLRNLRHFAFDAIVGSVGGLGVAVGEGCTHATLALALADAEIVDGSRILLTENFDLAAKQTISKAVYIEALPGVTATKTGGTEGLELDDAGITIKRLRFAGYTTAGDKAILCTANAIYCRVIECNFAASTATDIDDSLSPAGKKPVALANISEV